MNFSPKMVIYTEKKFLPPNTECIHLLYPFWGPATGEPYVDYPDYGRYNEYIKLETPFFEITDKPEDSDVFLLPCQFSFDEETFKIATELSQKAKLFNQKLLIFFNSDFDTPITIENALVFRTSLYKSLQKTNEYALPAWSADYFKPEKGVENSNALNASMPSISYCGYVDYINFWQKYTLKNILRNLIGYNTHTRIGHVLRGKAVRSLLKNPEISTNFIIRKGFWAQGIDDKHQARKEYVQNLLASDYALVARGGGNFSLRLYEVLSCGRVPVFINTDCVLPFDEFINWKNYVVWIEEKDIDTIGQKLVEYHKKMSKQDLENKKKACRKLYEEWLSPIGFFSNLHRYIN